MTPDLLARRPPSRWRLITFWIAAGCMVLLAAGRGTSAESKSRARPVGRGANSTKAVRATTPPVGEGEDPPESRRPRALASEAESDGEDAEHESATESVEILPVRGEVDAGDDLNPGAGPLEQSGLLGPRSVATSLPLISGMTILSLAPSILMMTTCFVRFTVVFGLLRQALGTQQLPPNSVLSALCLFLTCLVMQPVWKQSYDEGIRPYTDPAPGDERPSIEQATERTLRPLRAFMSEQIERAGNSDTVWMLLDAQRSSRGSEAGAPTGTLTYDEIPFPTLGAAYVLSELKAAFVIGFQILLPFVVIDLVVALLLTTLGMVMLPPTSVSFPFKLLLFVLIDGWTLTVGKLLTSVGS